MNGRDWPGKMYRANIELAYLPAMTGMSSSHVVSRDGSAFSTSSFEALRMVLAVMGASLKLCLVRVCDLI